MLLGGGLAIAALGSALAYITKTLANTNPLAILVGVLVAVLLVMIPISLVAYIKLRKRELSAILEGSGWAINARMRLTRKQGRGFTERPSYPKGTKGVHPMRWGLLIAAVVALAILAGGGYLVKGCLDRRCQKIVNKSADEPASAGEGEQIKETPGETGG
jgi:Flp pilus assembly pilin Flp